MTSHHPQTGNVIPLHRGPVIVRSDNIGSIQANALLGLYATIEEQARIAAVEADTRRDIRVMRVQAFVKWSCVVIAYVALLYFVFSLGRGAF